MLSTPREPADRGAEGERQLEYRQGGEQNGEGESEKARTKRSGPQNLTSGRHPAVRSVRRRVHTGNDPAKCGLRSFGLTGSTSLRIPGRSR